MTVTADEMLKYIDSRSKEKIWKELNVGSIKALPQGRWRTKHLEKRALGACGLLDDDIDFEDLDEEEKLAAAAIMVYALIGRHPESRLKDMHRLLLRMRPLESVGLIRDMLEPHDQCPGIPRLKFHGFRAAAGLKSRYIASVGSAYRLAGKWFQAAGGEFLATPSARHAYRRYFGALPKPAGQASTAVRSLEIMRKHYFNQGMDIPIMHCTSPDFMDYPDNSLGGSGPPTCAITVSSSFFRCSPTQQACILIEDLAINLVS